MPASTGQRVALLAGVIVAVVVLASLGGWRLVVAEMKQRVLEMLGPLGMVEKIDIGFSNVTLTHVRMRAPRDWPAGDTFRAERVALEFDLRSLLAKQVHFRNVTVDSYYLSVVRSVDGRMHLLPNLNQATREAEGQAPASAKRANDKKLIDHITLTRGTIEFFDQSVQKPAYRLLITDVGATVDHLNLPELTDATTLNMTGSIRGPSHTGTVSFGGWIKIASSDSHTHTTLRNVDISKLDPYLLKQAGTKAAVKSGTIDLSLDATVRNYRIRAPGTFTLHHLQLKESEDGNPLDTFLSIPTNAAVAALKDHHGEIKLKFQLDGDLRDPKFSLNESLSEKLGAGFAKALGVGAQGVAKGAGETIKGIGGALLNLLPK